MAARQRVGGSRWAPLALALEQLAALAAKTEHVPSPGPTSTALVDGYAERRWQHDLAALQALREVEQPQDRRRGLGGARRDLSAVARRRQRRRFRRRSGRWRTRDLHGKLCAEARQRRGRRVRRRAAARRRPPLGRATARSRGVGRDVGRAWPRCRRSPRPRSRRWSPIDQALLGPGEALDACRASSGATAGVQVLRSLLAEAGVQVLGPQETGDPQRPRVDRDRRDRSPGPRPRRPARSRDRRRGVADRATDPRAARRRLVDGHGRHRPRLDPAAAGLEKNELAGRGDRARRRAVARGSRTAPRSTSRPCRGTGTRTCGSRSRPGISCFEANKEYEHGGVSPQECVVPRLTVTAASRVPTVDAPRSRTSSGAGSRSWSSSPTA